MATWRAQDEHLLYKVVRLRYVDDLTQDRIAERLRISRFKVLRLLKAAHQRGIVRVELNLPDDAASILERELETRFRLRDSIVVAPFEAGEPAALAEVATAAANRLVESLQPSDILGVAYGTTVRAIIAAIPRVRIAGLKVVSLSGETPSVYPSHEEDPSSWIHRLAEHLGAEVVALPVPRYVASSTLRQAILSDDHLQDLLRYQRECSVAIFGIGSLDPLSETTRHLPLGDDDLAELRKRRAVGEICGRFFDYVGQPVPIPFDARHVAVSLADVSAIPTTIAVAFGSSKIRAITGALRARLVQILITDVTTAQGVLDANRVIEDSISNLHSTG